MMTGTEHPQKKDAIRAGRPFQCRLAFLPVTPESTLAISQQPQGYLLAISLSAATPSPAATMKRSRLFRGLLLSNRASDPRDTAYCRFSGLLGPVGRN